MRTQVEKANKVAKMKNQKTKAKTKGKFKKQIAEKRLNLKIVLVYEI